MPRMTTSARILPDAPAPRLTPGIMWAAVLASDRRYDGRFFTAVRTTGVCCRPSCTCRKPRRQNVRFYRTLGEALAAGFRPCKRCRPELAGGPAEADRRLAERALAFMRGHLGEPLTLARVAREGALSPSHFARRFAAADGRTPMRALADLRAARAAALIAAGRTTVLEAALEAGFGSAAACVRAVRRLTGRTPSALRRRAGGAKRRTPAAAGPIRRPTPRNRPRRQEIA